MNGKIIRGYILAETLMALGIITLTVMVLLHAQSTLIQRSRLYMRRTQFARVVYEETRRYLRAGGENEVVVELEGQTIHVKISENGKEVTADGGTSEGEMQVKCRWNCWNSGFTLLECLVALLVLNVFMLTITFLVPQVKWVREAIGHNREHQFELFLLQLEHELKDGEYEAYDNGIQVNKLVKEGGRWVPKKVLIHQYQGKIRKTFRGSGGHQPMLMGIQQATFIEKDGYVLIKVWYPDGEVNHGKWTIP